jgi:hypothetical protein
MPLPDVIAAPPGAPPSPHAETDTPEAERWRIRDGRAAEWVMRKLARAREQLVRIDGEMAEYQAQLDEWHRAATGELRSTASWAEALLGAWALAERDADPEARTQRLPSGNVATRWIPPRPQVLDPGLVAATLARARHPAYEQIVKPSVAIDVRELAKAAQVADEWELHLTCGCAPLVWQLTVDLGVRVGDPWPYREAEHDPDKTCTAEGLAVESIEAGRQRVAVLVLADNGSKVVWPLDGCSVVPGRLSTSVSVHG